MPRPPEEVYADPAFAALYDARNDWGEDFDFCARAAQGARSMLDIGCGTGMLAAKIAETVPRVMGADPAGAMLDIARIRPGGDRVIWIESDAESFDIGETFDLITMTGHAFQCLLTDDAQDSALRVMRRHLDTGGTLVFDTRNPAPRPWTAWVAARTRKSTILDDGSELTTWTTSSYDAANETLAYTQHFLIPGYAAPRASTAHLRFAPRSRIEAALAGAGLRAKEILGDWSGAAWAPASPEILVVAEPA